MRESGKMIRLMEKVGTLIKMEHVTKDNGYGTPKKVKASRHGQMEPNT